MIQLLPPEDNSLACFSARFHLRDGLIELGSATLPLDLTKSPILLSVQDKEVLFRALEQIGIKITLWNELR